MPFNQKPQKFNAKINAVTIGSGDKTVTIGGENSFPFYTFDAPTENTAKIGVEISDLGLDEFSEGVRAYYEGATTMAEIAKKAAAIEGADFVALILDGGDPNGANKSIEELIEVVKEVAEAIDCPLVVEGCKNVEKDAELLPKVAEVLQGRNAQKIDGIHPALRSLHRKYRRGEITRTLSLDIHKAGKKQPRQEENIQSYELLSEHKTEWNWPHNSAHHNFCLHAGSRFWFLRYYN